MKQFDIKNHKTFLKRCEYPSVTLNDLYIGASVSVYGRLLKVTDYGDVFTRSAFEQRRQRTFALIKPDAYVNMGKIFDAIAKNDFRVNKAKMVKLNQMQASELLAAYKEHPDYAANVRHLT